MATPIFMPCHSSDSSLSDELGAIGSKVEYRLC
jgi:hypothetical protein